jgi:hypothetical protein
MADDSPHRLTLDELLAFLDPVQRLAHCVELRMRRAKIPAVSGSIRRGVP